MSLIAAILILLVIGTAMYLIHAYVPVPWSVVLLVLCGIILIAFVLQITGLLDLGNMRLAPAR